MKHKTTTIVGIGPGDQGYLYPLAAKAIEGAELLIGGERNLREFDLEAKETFVIGNNLKEVAALIRENYGKKDIAVLASGDTGLFSIRGYLQKQLPELEFQVLPGISSLQYLIAKCNLNLNELKIVTLHGSDDVALKNTVARHRTTAIFAGSRHLPQEIAAALSGISFAEIKLTVGENLSYPDERIVVGSPEDIAQMEFSDLSLVIVENPAPAKRPWPYQTMGIPDSTFLRAEVPMTKSEIRAVVNSKLRLTETAKVLEIGAGTGSCTVEMALTAWAGHVWALEKNPEAIALARANFERFAIDNITLIEDTAPAGIPQEPCFDAVFIGGSGGNMEEIVAGVAGRTDRIVVTAVTVESVAEALSAFERHGFEAEIVEIAVARSRKAGTKHLMQAINPVTVITGEKL